MVTPWGNKGDAWRKRQCKEQCQVHTGEEDHVRSGWTISIRGQVSPWKSQSEWQRTEINGESTSMVWPTLWSRMAKEQNILRVLEVTFIIKRYTNLHLYFSLPFNWLTEANKDVINQCNKNNLKRVQLQYPLCTHSDMISRLLNSISLPHRIQRIPLLLQLINTHIMTRNNIFNIRLHFSQV